MAAVKRAALETARAGHGIAEHPAGHLAARRLERFRRDGAGRGRGQAGPLDWDDADDMSECAGAAGDPRGIRDAALIGVASDALLRVSEASALDAGDVSFRNDGSAHVDIRCGKTDQHGEGAVRYGRELRTYAIPFHEEPGRSRTRRCRDYSTPRLARRALPIGAADITTGRRRRTTRR